MALPFLIGAGVLAAGAAAAALLSDDDDKPTRHHDYDDYDDEEQQIQLEEELESYLKEQFLTIAQSLSPMLGKEQYALITPTRQKSKSKKLLSLVDVPLIDLDSIKDIKTKWNLEFYHIDELKADYKKLGKNTHIYEVLKPIDKALGVKVADKAGQIAYCMGQFYKGDRLGENSDFQLDIKADFNDVIQTTLSINTEYTKAINTINHAQKTLEALLAHHND